MNRISLLAALWRGLVCVGLAAAALTVQAQAESSLPERTAPATRAGAILWVGNSFFYYNNSLHGHFGQLAHSLGERARSTSVTISGAGLDWHDAASLVRPGGIGRYSFVGDNEIRFNEAGRQFDTAVLMDCSQCPVHPQLQEGFHRAVAHFSQTLAAAKVQTVLFMSWAYKDKPEMTQALAGQYTRAGNANGALVIPVGLAFAAAIEDAATQGQALELYQPDKRHPSLAGTYLAACTAFAALYGRSPVGATYTAGLAPEQAARLQAVAWATVQRYYRKA